MVTDSIVEPGNGLCAIMLVEVACEECAEMGEGGGEAQVLLLIHSAAQSGYRTKKDGDSPET